MATSANHTSVPIRIHDLSHDGRGVGRITDEDSADQGKTCFVAGALPGELVHWKGTKSKRSYNEAELVSILESSKERTEPACPHYSVCGGCQLQHLDPAAQLTWKQQQLVSAVERAGLQTDTWLPPLASEPWHYRRRTRLAVRYLADGCVELGFRRRKSRQLAAISECAVLDSRLEALLADLPGLANQLKSHGLTEIELSAAEQQLSVCCYLAKPFTESELCQWTDKDPVQLWLKLPGQEPQSVSAAPADLRISLTDKTHMNFMPSQFVQVNGAMNRAMIAQALALTQPNSNNRLLDLFCGAGNFSLAFAEQGAQVLGLEGSEPLCAQARKNATAMELANVDFQAMDLFQPDNLMNLDARDFNMAILDPPRAGAAQLVPWLNRLNVDKLLYVSCHPATMVRDIQGLNERYRLDAIGVMDMFPQTTHLEAMALLVKR